MSHLLDRLNFLKPIGVGKFAGGHGTTTKEAATGKTPIAVAGATTRSCGLPTG